MCCSEVKVKEHLECNDNSILSFIYGNFYERETTMYIKMYTSFGRDVYNVWSFIVFMSLSFFLSIVLQCSIRKKYGSG